MGKASKWIRNYLIGKKEEKYKKIDSASIEYNKTANNIGSQMESRKVKRRWSFGKIIAGRITGKAEVHKLCTSFDSNDSPKLRIQAVVETQLPNILSTSLAKVIDDTENSAATKIQAAFRSYLAKKALHALRGLVKIQALVRGHLVRKQTTSTLRGMHALMAIQVRARIQRIQMAEESRLLVGEQSREIPQYKHLIGEEKDSKDMSPREMLGVLKSRSGPLDRSLFRSEEHDSRTSYNSMTPNYMNKTESSMAKARSQSEPKQRPRRSMRHICKPLESTKDPIISLDGRRKYLSSSSSRFNHGSFDNSVTNLYWLLRTAGGTHSAAATGDSHL